jgi:hypothetical protein
MKLVLIEPIRPGPGNPAIRRGLFNFTGPSFPEIVEFISVVRHLPPIGPSPRKLSTAELIVGWTYFDLCLLL